MSVFLLVKNSDSYRILLANEVVSLTVCNVLDTEDQEQGRPAADEEAATDQPAEEVEENLISLQDLKRKIYEVVPDSLLPAPERKTKRWAMDNLKF